MIWVCLYNIVCVGVLAYLAVIFEKWWIILIAALLTMSYKEKSNQKGGDNIDGEHNEKRSR